MPDETTAELRRRVARRMQLVRQRTRLEKHIHAILARNLLPPCPAADLFGPKGAPGSPGHVAGDEQAAVARDRLGDLRLAKGDGMGPALARQDRESATCGGPVARNVHLASSKGPGD